MDSDKTASDAAPKMHHWNSCPTAQVYALCVAIQIEDHDADPSARIRDGGSLPFGQSEFIYKSKFLDFYTAAPGDHPPITEAEEVDKTAMDL